MKQILVDLETLGNDPYTGPIIAFAAVVFDFDEENLPTPNTTDYAVANERLYPFFYYPVSVIDQGYADAKIDPDTLKWWIETDEKMKLLHEIVHSDSAGNLRETLVRFQYWLSGFGEFNLWSHGVTYDCMHLAQKWPLVVGPSFTKVVPFRNMRDTRTLFDLYQSKFHVDKVPMPEATRKHHALEDAWRVATAVHTAWRALR